MTRFPKFKGKVLHAKLSGLPPMAVSASVTRASHAITVKGQALNHSFPRYEAFGCL